MFWKYFYDNFSILKIRTLISTYYNDDGDSVITSFDGNDVDIKQLNGNGDFRSDECLSLLDVADVIVTNPPFSLAREYMDVLMEHNKKFLIVGDMNWIGYKQIFPLLRNNQIWLGNNYVKRFVLPDGTEKQFGNKLWFTNLDIGKRHEPIQLNAHYDPNIYPKFDNFDAINVNKVADIPCDYDGVMGVPISFMTQYCPEQFDIVAFRKGNDGKDLVFTRERERESTRSLASLYDVNRRDDKKCRGENWSRNNLCQDNNLQEEIISAYYPCQTCAPGLMKNSYDRKVCGKDVYMRITIVKR